MAAPAWEMASVWKSADRFTDPPNGIFASVSVTIARPTASLYVSSINASVIAKASVYLLGGRPVLSLPLRGGNGALRFFSIRVTSASSATATSPAIVCPGVQ
jgi:hypothetical protein